ncbi:transporter substrate-binding domain-containing protein [Arsukibacterium sp.]|uniref:substrate-binding periplasmic protein n=1 Tax=Arsukibacterium sp. TaxID=1977258 RepID=UPI00299EDA01|nr:transporter substrate-binding domain-containing protein [Arsukibacterium sp.]MDX1678648.1 transporter substrate-binding domain-containing protein [Arsukibacterium sp.]
MMANTKLAIVPLLGLLLSAQVKAEQPQSTDVIYLASLEWPPYTGQQLADGGKTAKLVRHIFEQMGYQVVIEFLPWSRAVKLSTGTQPQYLAYFPEYPLAHADLKLSGCIGYSHVGLAEHKAAPLQLNSTADLKNYRLGVVQDYINTTTIDRMIRDELLMVETSLNDKQNLLRLAHRRLDAAVIDYDVMRYLIATEPELAPFSASLQFNHSEYEMKTMHMAVNIHHPLAALLTEFNNTLNELPLPYDFSIEMTADQAGLCKPAA